jgi:hypothetical protein
MASSGVRRFRWSRAYGLRLVGAAVVGLALVWVVAAVAGFATWSLVLLLFIGLLVLALGVRFLVAPPVLLEVSNEGYRMRYVRGGGPKQARWAEVSSVEGGVGSTGAVMSITLASGLVTVVPLGLLGLEGVAAEREVHDRLNAAFGYRRLGGR